MKSNHPILIIFLFLFFVFIISSTNIVLLSAAQPSQQYAKIFLNPFYRASMNSNTNYTYTLPVFTPDKIGTVYSAIIAFDVYLTPTVNYDLWVNGQPCNNPRYTVSTTYSGAAQGRLYFDCSNRITKEGYYNITIKADKNSGASVSWIDLTYSNKPQGSIEVHGTEYNVGDPGKVWLQLLDPAKTPITNATCFMTMYTPNNLKLYSYLQMTYLENGIHYFDFFAPEAVGVYPVIADCYYITSTKLVYANNYSLAVGTVVSGNTASLSSNDGNRLKLSEQTVDGPGLDFNISLTNITDISSETNLVVGLHGRWSGRDTDPVYMQIWNYTSGSWINLPNTVPNTGGIDVDTTNVIIIPSDSNATAIGLIKGGNVTLRFVDANLTDTDLEQLQIDSVWINIVAQGSTGTWEQVKGSSEVHVATSGGHLYTWSTLCDDHNPSCALFSSSSELTEGTINETLTINNIYRASLQDTIEYDTALGLDCTGVLSIIETYDDGTTLDVTGTTLYDVGTQQNCKMNIPVVFESNQQSMKIKIVSDNYPKWEVEWAKNVVDGMAPTITDYCNNVATQNGIIYNLPINTTLTGLSPDVAYCYRAMDDLWYFENNYQLSQSVNTIGPYLSHLSESRFYYPLIYDHYNKFKQSINPITATARVFGTDYQINDSGKIFLQMLLSNNVPVNNASCFASVFYPNGTLWLSTSGMTYQTGSNGIYYLDFTSPSIVGIYMVDTICSYSTQTFSTNATAYVIGKGWYFGGTGSSLTTIDGNFLNISEENYNPGYTNTTVRTLLMGHLDEGNGTTTEDSSANPTTGTHINGPTLGIPGVSGAGVYYPVGSIYTNYAQVSKFNLNSTEAYMVCFSFNESTSNSNGNRLVDSLGATGEGFRFSFDNGNAIRFVSDRSGTGAQTLNSGTTWLDSTWHTYCGFANFTTMTVYVDGVQLVTQNVAQSGTMNLANGISLASLSTGGNYANVALDEVCYMKGTFGSGQTAPILAAAYNSSKQCGVANSSLDINVTIPNITPVNITSSNPVYYYLSSTYLWNGIVPDNVNVQIWNYTANSWFTLPTNLTYTTSTLTTSNVINVNNISTNFLSNNTMIVRYYSLPSATTPSNLKLDQVRFDQINNVQFPEDAVKGGGELNIRNYSFDLIPKIPQNVWNYQSRNLTYIDYNAIAQNVWNFSTRNLTYYQDVTNYSLIAQMVWNYVSRNLTYTPDMTNYFTIQGMVWNATNRNLTYYPTQNDLTNYTLIGETVWNFTNRNLTYYNLGNNLNASDVWNYVSRNLTYYQQQDNTNYTLINQGVWSYVNRSLTYYEVNNISTSDIWNYVNRSLTQNISQEVWLYQNRSLTYYPDITNYNQIQSMVWNATNRSLTQDIPFEVWTYSNRSLTQNVSMEVWQYYNRSLTYYPDVTDYNLIYSGVWNYTNRNLTYYPDMTNYTNVAQSVWGWTGIVVSNILNYFSSSVWNYTDRNLTYYPDMTNYTLINEGVWNYNNRSLTYYNLGNNLSAVDVWGYLNRSLTYYEDVTNYTQVANVVWVYNNRTLTSMPYNNISVEDIWNFTNRSLTQDIAFQVWTYNNRNLTQNISLEVWNYYNRSLTYYPDVDLTGISTAVWNFTNRNLTYYPDLTNYTLINEGVWSFNNRTLTDFNFIVNINISSLNLTEIAKAVWNYIDRNLTYTPDMTNYLQIQNMVWNATNRNLTYYPTQLDLTNYTLIGETVWNFNNRNLTYYDLGNNLNANDIWNYVSRNLTYYEQVDLTNYTLITENIWSFNNRTLTYYEINNISASDIWNYANRSLTQNFSQEVWLYYNRSLTYYPDVSNYSLMADTVWQYVNRSLTQDIPFEVWSYNNRTLNENISFNVWQYYNRTLNYYPDVTNYDLIQIMVWNATNRTLTDFNFVINVNMSSFNLTQVAQAVWNYVDRNLTYTPDMTNYYTIQGMVWNATNRSLTYYEVTPSDINSIASAVWNFTNRNLTYYDLGNNLSAGDVWNYVSRNLTYYEQQDNTNYTLITENVWSYNNRSLTYYLLSNLSAQEIWDYTNRSLTQNIAQEVWVYQDRNLTYYDLGNNLSSQDIWSYVNRSLTQDIPFEVWSYNNRTLNENISFNVWNYFNRSLTYYPDVTNYSLIPIQVWEYDNRTLTDFNFVVDVNTSSLNLTAIAEAVWGWNGIVVSNILDYFTNAIWSAPNRNLTYYDLGNNLNASEVWSYVNRSLTQNVSEEVWLYQNRTLTYYDLGNNISVADIWNYFNRSLTQDIPFEVWTYGNRSLSENISLNVWTYYNRSLTYYPDVTNYSLIPIQVWEYNNRSLTDFNFLVNVNMSSLNLTEIAENVWTYNNRSLTFYEVNNITAADIWSYVNRTLTDYNQSDLTDYVKIQTMVWNATNRNLTYYEVTQVNTTAIAVSVWDYTNRTLTYYEVNNITAQDIWDYTNRTLTSFDFIVDINMSSLNLTQVAESVWTYNNRSLTFYDVNNISVEDVWNYVNRTLTDYNQTDLTDYDKIQTMVWNATNRTLTSLDFIINVNTSSLNLSQVAESVWSYDNRSLTYYEVTQINESSIALNVWDFNNRTLTYYLINNITAQDIWGYTDRNLTYYQDVTNYTLIQEMVWNATQRTLTELNLTVNVNTTAISDAVWNYVNRTLTDYNQSDLTDYNRIQAMTWNATIRTLTDFNFTVNATINNTAVADAVWAYTNKTVQFANGSVDTVNDIQNMGHTYVGGTEYTAGSNGKITIRLVRGTGSLAEIETGAACNLTIYYPNMTEFVINATMTELGNGAYYYDFITPNVLGIYTYYTNCNITDRFYFSLDDFHVYANNYSEIPPAVWNYTDRNLTYYPLVNVTNLTVNINGTKVAEDIWSYNGTINNNILSQIGDYVWYVFDGVNNFMGTIVNGVWTRTPRTLTTCNGQSQYGYYNERLPMLNSPGCNS